MAQQIVNIGLAPNDNTGDTLRQGGAKINANFTELYSASIPQDWGTIGGTLSDQTDLQSALDAKADVATTLAGYGITDAVQPADIADFETTSQLDARDAAQVNKVAQLGTLTYGAIVDLDMAALSGLIQTITLTGDLELTASNQLAGRNVAIRLIGDSTDRDLVFPAGWGFLGSGRPTSLDADKVAILSITFFGSTDADAICSYSEVV